MSSTNNPYRSASAIPASGLDPFGRRNMPLGLAAITADNATPEYQVPFFRDDLASFQYPTFGYIPGLSAPPPPVAGQEPEQPPAAEQNTAGQTIDPGLVTGSESVPPVSLPDLQAAIAAAAQRGELNVSTAPVDLNQSITGQGLLEFLGLDTPHGRGTAIGRVLGALAGSVLGPIGAILGGFLGGRLGGHLAGKPDTQSGGGDGGGDVAPGSPSEPEQESGNQPGGAGSAGGGGAASANAAQDWGDTDLGDVAGSQQDSDRGAFDGVGADQAGSGAGGGGTSSGGGSGAPGGSSGPDAPGGGTTGGGVGPGSDLGSMDNPAGTPGGVSGVDEGPGAGTTDHAPGSTDDGPSSDSPSDAPESEPDGAMDGSAGNSGSSNGDESGADVGGGNPGGSDLGESMAFDGGWVTPDRLMGADPAGPDDGAMWLDEGEFIVPARHAARHAPALERIRAGVEPTDHDDQARYGMGMNDRDGDDRYFNGDMTNPLMPPAQADETMQGAARSLPPEQKAALASAIFEDPNVGMSLIALLGPGMAGLIDEIVSGAGAPGAIMPGPVHPGMGMTGPVPVGQPAMGGGGMNTRMFGG